MSDDDTKTDTMMAKQDREDAEKVIANICRRLRCTIAANINNMTFDQLMKLLDHIEDGNGPPF